MKMYEIGDVKIYPIKESVNPATNPTFFFPNTTNEMWEKESSWMKPNSMNEETGNLIIPVICYLIDTGKKKILLDTGVGDNKERLMRPDWHLKNEGIFLKELQSIDVTPEMIDYVISTHLHPDHVGWFTIKNGDEWIPTFPNATHIIQKAEFDYWKEMNSVEPVGHFEDSVLPVLNAGLIKLVEPGFVLEDVLSYIEIPGHTPNHSGMILESSGEVGIFPADIVHTPAQFKHPDWYVRFDNDPPMAVQTRLDFFEKYADSNIIMFPSHVYCPGMIVRDGESYKFECTDN